MLIPHPVTFVFECPCLGDNATCSDLHFFHHVALLLLESNLWLCTLSILHCNVAYSWTPTKVVHFHANVYGYAEVAYWHVHKLVPMNVACWLKVAPLIFASNFIWRQNIILWVAFLLRKIHFLIYLSWYHIKCSKPHFYLPLSTDTADHSLGHSLEWNFQKRKKSGQHVLSIGFDQSKRPLRWSNYKKIE